MIKWKTEKRKVIDLIPSTYNPRKISDKERQDLLVSIQEFEQVVPVVINTDEHIIGGHLALSWRVKTPKGNATWSRWTPSIVR